VQSERAKLDARERPSATNQLAPLGERELGAGQAAPGCAAMPRVLVVDDHPDARAILAEALASYGFAVDVAVDGGEAVAKAAASLPDAVVLDLSLPVLDGFTVSRRLREDPRTRGIAILALTAYTDAENHARARTAGCTAVLSKPALPRRVADLLLEVLGRPALVPGAAGEPSTLDDTWARLGGMRERYVASLPRRSGELAEVWRQIRREEPPAAGRLEAFAARLHRLAGSAGTFGLPDIGRCAAALQAAVDRFAAGEARGDGAEGRCRSGSRACVLEQTTTWSSRSAPKSSCSRCRS
jgi:CheY-like chemotaxis protein